MLSILFQRLARSRALARWVLGVELPAIGAGEHYFDATTLALVRSARRVVPRGARVLDVGAGSAAVVGLWLWRRRGCSVTCTEVHPELAARARESVALNGAPLEVVEGEHFAGIAEHFDWVLFNPPYVPTAVGRARGLPERFRTQWDGGADGSEAIARFLAALSRDGQGASALLGVNRRHVPRARVLERIERQAGLELRRTLRHPLLPSEVYVLASTKSPRTSTSTPDA